MTIAAATLVAATAAFLARPARTLRVEANGVSLAKVERGVFRDIIPLRGKIVALETVYLGAIEGGRVERVLVQPGDPVSSGSPLCGCRIRRWNSRCSTGRRGSSSR